MPRHPIELPPGRRDFHPLAKTEAIPTSEILAFAGGNILERDSTRYVNTEWFPTLPFRGYPGDTPEAEEQLLGAFSKKVVAHPEVPGERLTPISEAMLPVSAGRTVLYPPVAFADRNGEVFYDLVVHSGLTKVGKMRALELETREEGPATAALTSAEALAVEPDWAIPEIESAIADWENSGKLHEGGVRTSLGVIIIEDEDGHFAREVRAMREGLRVKDLFLYTDGGADEDRHRALIEYVKGKIFRDRSDVSDTEYLRWFASTLGEQAARLHNLGYIHGDLGGYEDRFGVNIGNVTLAAEIIDHEDGEFISRQVMGTEGLRELGRQYAYLLVNARTVQDCLGLRTDQIDAAEVFTRSFLAHLPNEDIDGLGQVFQVELQGVVSSLGRKRRLPRIFQRLATPYDLRQTIKLWQEK